MSRVICDLPNASLEISGVRFQKLEDGRFISDEIGDEATAIFLSIPGYVLDEDDSESDLPPPPDVPVNKTKAQLAAEAKKTGSGKTPTAKQLAKIAADAKETPAVVDPVVPVVETPAVIDPVAPVVVPAEGADQDGGENAQEKGGVTDPAAAPVVTDPANPEVATEPSSDVF